MSTTNAQSISRLLRSEGYRPSSTQGGRRWAGLLCTQSGTEVRVRVWQDVRDEEPSGADREIAAEIAELLTSKGYVVRYTTGSYSLYVAGKEI